MKRRRIAIAEIAPPRKQGREIAAAAEPRFGRDHVARIQVHGRHVRIARVDDDRNAGRPETRIIFRAGDLCTEFRRELAAHGGNVDAGFLEDAAMEERHFAAAARRAGVIGSLPGFARETPGGAPVKLLWRAGFDRLQRRANAVAQLAEPGARLLLVRFVSHRGSRSFDAILRRAPWQG
jgi:hypothetical protein